MEEVGACVCRRVLLGTLPAARRNNAAEHGLVDAVVHALRGVLLRRRDFAEFLFLARWLLQLMLSGLFLLFV